MLTRPALYESKAAYQILVDGEPLGVTFDRRVVLRDCVPGQTCRSGVRCVWFDGSEVNGLSLCGPQETNHGAELIDTHPVPDGEKASNLNQPE